MSVKTHVSHSEAPVSCLFCTQCSEMLGCGAHLFWLSIRQCLMTPVVLEGVPQTSHFSGAQHDSPASIVHSRMVNRFYYFIDKETKGSAEPLKRNKGEPGSADLDSGPVCRQVSLETLGQANLTTTQDKETSGGRGLS